MKSGMFFDLQRPEFYIYPKIFEISVAHLCAMADCYIYFSVFPVVSFKFTKMEWI
jgi:hypothetical protein